MLITEVLGTIKPRALIMLEKWQFCAWCGGCHGELSLVSVDWKISEKARLSSCFANTDRDLVKLATLLHLI